MLFNGKRSYHIGVHGAGFVENFGDHLLLERARRIVLQKFDHANVDLILEDHFQTGSFSSFLRGLLRIPRLDALVFSGGGYLGERQAGNQRWNLQCFVRYVLPALIARTFKVPYYVIGVEVGPLSSRLLGKAVRAMLRGSQCCWVRNTASLQWCQKMNVPAKHGADIAQNVLFLENLEGSARNEIPRDAAKYVIIHQSQYDLSEDNRKQLNLAISRISKAGFDLVFLYDNANDPALTSAEDNKDIQKYLDIDCEEKTSHIRVVAHSKIDETVAVISNASGVITPKLHVGIVAVMSRVPSIAIPVHLKTPRYYHENGLEDRCLHGQADPVEFSAKLDAFAHAVCEEQRTPLPAEAIQREDEMINEFLAVFDPLRV